jgi:hypothetical protein
MQAKDQPQPKSIPITFVFNSPTLVPWKVVSGIQGDTLEDEAKRVEAILIWQEVYREKNRFREGDEVIECNNSTLKMTVRRILRQSSTENGEIKKRLLGIETYWFVAPSEYLMQILQMNMRGRKVPDVQLAEQE